MLRYLSLLFAFSSFIPLALGSGNNPTELEIAMLPSYCQTRLAKKNPVAVRKWKRILGKDWAHMHHYCDALVTLMRARKDVRWVNPSLGNLDYSINAATPKWKLLPEAYVMRGKAKVLINQNEQAIRDFIKAVNVNANYIASYIALSDVFISLGDTKTAREYLEQGLKQKPKSKQLNRRYKELTGEFYTKS